MIDLFKYIGFIVIMVSGMVITSSCEEEIPEMSRENKLLADSIIVAETRLLVKEIDSLCQLAYQQNFDRAVDSISAVRLSEIEKYIPR